ncbi:MAG: response regulator [Thauera sp.]
MTCPGDSLSAEKPDLGSPHARRDAGSPLCVLVVDDAAEIRLLLRLILEQAPCRTVFAADTAQAREWIARGLPELVLLDIGLGVGPDGLELCAALKRDESDAFPKVVMLTADDDSRTIDLSRTCGADGYVVKPFTPMQILGLVDSFDAWRFDPARKPPAFWPPLRG